MKLSLILFQESGSEYEHEQLETSKKRWMNKYQKLIIWSFEKQAYLLLEAGEVVSDFFQPLKIISVEVSIKDKTMGIDDLSVDNV